MIVERLIELLENMPNDDFDLEPKRRIGYSRVHDGIRVFRTNPGGLRVPIQSCILQTPPRIPARCF